MRRLSLMGLVFANLAFVQITEAARLSWILALAALTLASPLLERTAHRLAFRAVWNLAVLGVFAMLVLHLRDSGPAHLLEDGLLLASFCQVHLINNLGRGQKPDLLFFNSFLIAVVTSFLSFDLGYCLVFLVYAPLLVLALEVEATGRAPLLPALGRAALLLALSFGAFLLVPRDFQRRGLLGDALRNAATAGRVDFSEKVSLERNAAARASERIVLRARLKRGVRADVPAYWRGATLDHFDGSEWQPAGRVVTQGPWRRTGHNRFERDAGGARGATVEVALAGAGAGRLFAPLSSAGVRVDEREGDLLVQEFADLTLRCTKTHRPLLYEVDLVRADRGDAARLPPGWNHNVATHLWVDPGHVPALARQLALEAQAQAGQAPQPQQVVARLRAMISARYRYLPAGSPDAARDLAEFVHGGAGAHCEYFATLLAVMLRTLAIPCRLVTGYRSEEWDEETGTLTVREKHAHAWVEVLDPGSGWYVADATPSSDDAATSDGLWLMQRLRAWGSGLWERVTGFSGKGRARALAFAARHAWLLALAVVAGAAARRLLRMRRTPPAERAYRHALRRAGLALAPGETPRELLLRARALPLRPERLAPLAAATSRHEAAAYGVAAAVSDSRRAAVS